MDPISLLGSLLTSFLSPHQLALVQLIVLVIVVLLAFVSQFAAWFGKPKVVEAVKPISAAFDILAGNINKAKNAPKALAPPEAPEPKAPSSAGS